MEGIRGNDISMIFQEPMTSLNPLLTVGRQISEAIALHRGLSRREARDQAIEMLRRVHIPEAEHRVEAYPHQLSGGMRQRVMIAMAVSCDPKVLIADEPTTALDVTIQAQILDLMRELQDRLATAIMLITHDMGVVAENADRVVVMYAGRKVEEASAEALFEQPGHPYTKGLLGSIPNLEVAAHTSARRPRLNEIKGMVPSLADLPKGCTFAPRCAFATAECGAASPPLLQHRPDHWVACWHAERLLECVQRADHHCSRCATSRSISRSTRASSRASPAMSMRWTASRYTSIAARHWGSSARAAAASRQSAAPC